MTWQDVVAIVLIAAMFVAYLHYIHNVYPTRLTDELERDYYTCYDITVREADWDKPIKISTAYSLHEEHDPGDEQPKR